MTEHSINDANEKPKVVGRIVVIKSGVIFPNTSLHVEFYNEGDSIKFDNWVNRSEFPPIHGTYNLSAITAARAPCHENRWTILGDLQANPFAPPPTQPVVFCYHVDVTIGDGDPERHEIDFIFHPNS